MDTAITVGSVLLVLIALVVGLRRLVLAGRLVARARGRREKSGRSVTRAGAALTGVIATRIWGLALVVCAVTCWRVVELEVGWPGIPDLHQGATSPLRQLATDAARRAFASNGLVSLAVAVVADGKAEIVCLGARALAGREPVSDSTRFEIGSITKTFTGILLAEQVEAGTVTLDQRFASLLPVDVTVPRRAAQEITLRHLATHTSGLRGMPPDDWTESQVLAELGRTQLESAPGEQMAYSNFGAGLLGYALSRKQGTYAAAIRTEILTPLGMHDTGIEPDDSSRPQMTQGYRGAIRVGPLVVARRAARVGDWTEPVLGAGAIVSSARDMLKYLQANMAGSGTPLHLAMQRSHRELFRSATAGGIGMLWIVPRDSGIIWHNGQTPGYSSYLGFSNDGRFGVVVLAGTRGYVPTELGVELLRQMRRHSTPGFRTRRAR
jgi:CubicO group peptidase (beta-lactamase class C family)